MAAELRTAGGSARAVAGDLLTDAGADELVAAIGPIDVLVANYGVAESGSWFGEATDETAWFDSYNKNVLSAIRLVRRCTPAMREARWGRVILVGTVGSLRPGTRQPQYYAASPCRPLDSPQRRRVVEVATDRAYELRGGGAVEGAVIPRQAERESLHPADRTIGCPRDIVAEAADAEDCDVGRIDDGGESIDAEHA